MKTIAANYGRILYVLIGFCVVFLLVGLTSPFAAAAQEAVGQVALATGEVTAATDAAEVRPLKQGDPVFTEDTISTAPNSRARLVFSDNSVMAMRPSTRIVVAEFLNTGDSQVDRSTMTLIRGGFRAVTGGIGQENPESYRVETPVATIGIRGTEFRVRYCQGDCLDLQHIGIDPPPDGLYTQTLVGTTLIGSVPIPAGQSSFTDPQGFVNVLLEPPPILQLDPEMIFMDVLQEALNQGMSPEQALQRAEATQAAYEAALVQTMPLGQEFQEALLRALAQGMSLEALIEVMASGENFIELLSSGEEVEFFIPAKPVEPHYIDCK